MLFFFEPAAAPQKLTTPCALVHRLWIVRAELRQDDQRAAGRRSRQHAAVSGD